MRGISSDKAKFKPKALTKQITNSNDFFFDQRNYIPWNISSGSCIQSVDYLFQPMGQIQCLNQFLDRNDIKKSENVEKTDRRQQFQVKNFVFKEERVKKCTVFRNFPRILIRLIKNFQKQIIASMSQQNRKIFKKKMRCILRNKQIRICNAKDYQKLLQAQNNQKTANYSAQLREIIYYIVELNYHHLAESQKISNQQYIKMLKIYLLRLRNHNLALRIRTL